jgi:mono/diheme cytochrome c family protein
MAPSTTSSAVGRGWFATLVITVVCATISCSRDPSSSSRTGANAAPPRSDEARTLESVNPPLVPSIARGKYLADAGDCASCHTRSGGEPFAGGVAFSTPAGILYSANITSDRETGIGKWEPGDLRRAMHDGIGTGGRRLYPAFPYTSFTKLSDEDVDSIFEYLKTISPVRYSPPTNDFLLRQRWGLLLWNGLFFTPGRFQQNYARSEEWNRGAYLVEGAGHCGACHSPRNALQAEVSSLALSGGSFQETVEVGKVRRWSAVNLTQAQTGLAAWSLTDIAKYLKTGMSQRAGGFGPMSEVIANSLRYLTDQDIHAMAVYLKSLPPQPAAVTASASADVKDGAAIYKAHCAECHMSSGRGGMFGGPPLAASAVVQAEDPASLINIILDGQTPGEIALGQWETMKAYAASLSDTEIAALCNYIRHSWGNVAPAVTATDVSRLR